MGDRLEERKDFSADVAVKLPEATKLAEVRCLCMVAGFRWVHLFFVGWSLLVQAEATLFAVADERCT